MKRFICTVIAVILLACSTVLAVSADGIKLTVNGKGVDCTEYGAEIIASDDGSDNLILPLKAFTDGIGAEYSFDEESGKVAVTYEDKEFVFTVNDNVYEYNGDALELTDDVLLENETVLITSNAIYEAFDPKTVKFNADKGVLAIVKKIETDGDMPVANKKATTVTDSDSEEKGGLHEFFTVVGAINVGFVTTFKLFIATLLGAIPLGLIICLCSISKIKPIKWISRFLVWIIRGTPLMLQLLIIYYIPGIAMGGNSPWPSGESGKFLAAAIAFILNYSFYFSEIFRGGIENIPQGQVEAGQVLGMTKTQIFFHVTLLQMVKRIVPPMSNEIITLVKDTSIARIISLQEVIWAGYAFLKSSHGYSGLLWPLFFTGVYYLAFNGILTLLFGYIEKKLSYFKA